MSKIKPCGFDFLGGLVEELSMNMIGLYTAAFDQELFLIAVLRLDFI
jgi:hypothetical protein